MDDPNWCYRCDTPKRLCTHTVTKTKVMYNTTTNADAFLDWIISLDDIEMMHVRRGISLTTIIDEAKRIRG